MAHLITESFANDIGTWKLQIVVTDINKSVVLYVRGDEHIGGVMRKLVQEIDLPQDWSDHALWWPDKCKWLQHTRSTLDQVGVNAATYLEFTPMHKYVKVQLPDLQIIDARLDFSVNVLRVTKELCKDIGIKNPEELSLKRFYLPDELRKQVNNVEHENANAYFQPGVEYVGPGTLRRQAPISATLNSQGNHTFKRHQSPAINIQGQVFNSSELGTMPKSGTLPRGASPGPGAYYGTLGRVPQTNGIGRYNDELNFENLDIALIHSPRILPTKDNTLFRPQSYWEKAAINRGWLDSSRSLMEQGIKEDSLVLLRFKFMNFFDLNPKYDAVRINQLYEQAKWSILLDEIDHTEEEAALLAALQLQATLQRNVNEDEISEKDDVDMLLDELEQNLDAAAMSRRADITSVPELSEYLKYMKPKKLGFKNFKRAYFVFRDLYLSYYGSGTDINGQPLSSFTLKGCEVNQDVSVSQQKYHIKLLIPTSEGMNEFILKCDTEHQFARWLAACKLASRGKSMADASYNGEVEQIKKLLSLQSKTSNGTLNKKRSQSVQLPSDFNVDEFISQRWIKRSRSKQVLQNRVSECHNSIKTLSCTEAKLQYIKTWQALPEHGVHYFIVKFGSNKKPEIVAVAVNRLMKINPDNGESTKTWRFSNMKKWHVNWEIRELMIQFDGEDVNFKPLSADCKVVHEFIGGYIFLQMRSKEKSQTLDEELFHSLTGGWK
uniref:PH domain-containing protein n=1 Tax=Strongyloides stercoralis TaxID=6248 RepID=A0A0K0EMK2_STRER